MPCGLKTPPRLVRPGFVDEVVCGLGVLAGEGDLMDRQACALVQTTGGGIDDPGFSIKARQEAKPSNP